MDPVRQLILSRSQELGISHLELSRRAGKNEAYVHQFIYRGSPRRLPEEVRAAIAEALDVPEDALRPQPAPANGNAPERTNRPARPAARTVATVPKQSATESIPVFREGDTVDPSAAREWMPHPVLTGIPGGYAVFARLAGGRLQPGDLAIVRPTQPARVGDTVVVLDTERKIIGIGNVAAIDGDTATVVRDPAGATVMTVTVDQLQKVQGARFS